MKGSAGVGGRCNRHACLSASLTGNPFWAAVLPNTPIQTAVKWHLPAGICWAALPGLVSHASPQRWTNSAGSAAAVAD